MRFHIVIAVWGDRFIGQLSDICLSCLLAPDNLPAIPPSERSRCLFVTRASDVPRLKNKPMIRKLEKIIPIEYLEFDPGRYANTHLALSSAHRMALDLAAKDSAYLILLAPDLIFSSNTLASVRRQALDGKSVVMVSGLRLATETAVPALHDARLSESCGDNPILAPRNLMRFATQHFHPEVARYRFDSPHFTQFPLVCLWPVGDEGLLDRSFHLHPLMLDMREARPEALETLNYDTIDGAYIFHAFCDRSKIHVECDSDNMLVFSLSSVNECVEPIQERRANIALLRRTAYLPNVNALHRFFFDRAIKLHSGDLNDRWFEIERDTSTLSGDFRPLLRERFLCVRPRRMAIFVLETNPPLRRAARFVRSLWRRTMRAKAGAFWFSRGRVRVAGRNRNLG